ILINAQKNETHARIVGRRSVGKVDVIKSLEKTFVIMDAIAASPDGRTLADLFKLTGMPRATVHRLLWTLAAHNVVSYSPATKTYLPGVKTMEWSQNIMTRYDWRSVLEPHLDRLVADTHCTILVGVLCDGKLVYINKREADTELKVSATVGRVCPPHRGILGKVLMAYLPTAVVDELLIVNPLDHLTDSSIISVEELHQMLAVVRRDGYIVAHDQTIFGVSGIGAPIFGKKGKVVAAIGLLAPSSSFTDDRIELYRERLLEVTRAISPNTPS
ncbi:MAG TPA: IclR family transcriptional regulator, partial [Negativicutes bacterium]|nr:IclR family transcriptional regulator [Negativicutes bacterium]